MKKRRVALMTGGGDAPGLNGIIESCCRVLLREGFEVIGVRDGFEGIFGGLHRVVTEADLELLHSQAGTFLGTSNKSQVQGRETEFLKRFEDLGCEGMIVAGGDGTFASLSKLGFHASGEPRLKIVGVPKTIDNDLHGTDVTFGFDTACSVIADSIDALRATADAHRRVMCVEAMGRTAGWLALGGGLASYADVILLPERPFDRASLRSFIRAKQSEGRRGLMICVAEGARAQGEDPSVAFRVDDSPQQERYGGMAERLARWIEQETAWESRHVVLGHLQRSKHPSATDRFLTLAMGVEAARLVLESEWGKAAVVRDGKVTRAPIQELMGGARLVPEDHRWVKLAQALGIFV